MQARGGQEEGAGPHQGLWVGLLWVGPRDLEGPGSGGREAAAHHLVRCAWAG